MTFAPSYSISKAGLNMAVAKFAAAYKDEGIIFLNVSPGLVKTMAGREYSLNTYLFIVVLTHLVLKPQRSLINFTIRTPSIFESTARNSLGPLLSSSRSMPH